MSRRVDRRRHQDLTGDQNYELHSVFDNEPFDYAVTEGFIDYVIEHHGIKDPTLERLVENYKRASRNLKKHLKNIGVRR